jgi:hypothetical protein
LIEVVAIIAIAGVIEKLRGVEIEKVIFIASTKFIIEEMGIALACGAYSRI